jgi:hypothetical protein
MKSAFETASNTVTAVLGIDEIKSPDRTSRSCFFLTIGAAGVGRPSKTEVRDQKSEVRKQELTSGILTSDL